MVFAAHTLAAHCFFVFELIIFLEVKKKNQRAAANATKQKTHAKKKLPEAIVT